jgi:hypothetical protein
MSTLVPGIALGAALAAACSDRSSEPTGGGSAIGSTASGATAASAATSAPRPTAPVTVRTPAGAVAMSIQVAGATCTATFGDHTLTVTRDGDGVQVGGAAVRLERTAAGDQLSVDGARVGRIWRDPARPGHVDVVDPGGMAIFRFTVTGASATLVDAADAPFARVDYEGGRFVAKGPSDSVLDYVMGGDADLAALLSGPIPPQVGAVAACDRLLPVTAPVSP